MKKRVGLFNSRTLGDDTSSSKMRNWRAQGVLKGSLHVLFEFRGRTLERENAAGRSSALSNPKLLNHFNS